MSYIGYYLWGNSTPEDLIDSSPVPRNNHMINELNEFKRSNLKRTSNSNSNCNKTLNPTNIIDELSMRVKQPKLKKVKQTERIIKKTNIEMLEEELKKIKLKLRKISNDLDPNENSYTTHKMIQNMQIEILDKRGHIRKLKNELMNDLLNQHNVNKNNEEVINNTEMITLPKHVFEMMINEQVNPLIKDMKKTTLRKQKMFKTIVDKHNHVEKLLEELNDYLFDFKNVLIDEIGKDIQVTTDRIYALEEVRISSEPYLSSS